MIILAILLTISLFQGSGQQAALDDLSNQNLAVAANYPKQGPNQPQDGTAEVTNFEIKATMTKCPKPKACDCDNAFQCANETLNSNLRTKEFRSKCEEQADDKVLKICDKKISLTLKIKNHGVTNCKPQYIILDHVFDPASDQKQRLLNTYVLKIVQRPVYQVYDLIFENVVNSGPKERVVNKNDPGFSGCSTDSANPTCGTVRYNEREVPYSTGFCCSCHSPRETSPDSDSVDLSDANIVENNHPSINNENIPEANEQNVVQTSISSIDLPNLGANEVPIDDNIALKETENPYLPDYNKNDYQHYGLSEKCASVKDADIPLTAQNMMVDNAPRVGRQSVPKLRFSKTRLHKRGGQDCDDKFTPPGADPKTYHDSAHCMDFSEVWYSVYRIAHPDIDHSVDIQIFEKVGIGGNKIAWREVTCSGKISVGTTQQRYANSEGTILAYYTVNTQIESEFAVDCKSHKLLIPEVTGKDARESQYPEVAGGPPEYLIVREGDIDLSGKTCNKAGVGYEAFANQPDKCDKDRNSCLQNQPKHLWQHDHDLEANGKKGCYFLKNYGLLPDNPVQIKPCNGSSKKPQNKLLFMYYVAPVVSNVNINFAADSNAMLKPDAMAMITEVYTETLNPKRVTVTAKIFNSGLVTSVFYVGIGACPLEIPASFGSISSQPVIMAPQHQHIFNLEIYCELPIANFFCSLEVFNLKQQLIAVRRIRFQRADRCICVWYCQCGCFNSDYGLRCGPLEIEQYHAAGFQGGMPIATQVVNYSAFDDTISVTLHIVLYFCLTLWYMGLIKALIGMCVLPIGLWGLDKILDLPKKLNRYYEPELQGQKVIYDDEGWPIHPETGKKVNNVAPPTQFAINMVFFFVFPFALMWNMCKNLLGPKYSSEEFSELDICKCRASQISLLKNYSLQNTTTAKTSRQSKRRVGYKNENTIRKSSRSPSGSRVGKRGDPSTNRSKTSFSCRPKTRES